MPDDRAYGQRGCIGRLAHRGGFHAGCAAHGTVEPGLPEQIRYLGYLRRCRLWSRNRPDHGSDGRLRRFRCSAVPLSGKRMQRLHPDPLGADSDRYRVSPHRRSPPVPLWAGAREHLPREDHQLGRSRDREAEQGRDAAQPQDHAGLPQRRVRGHLCVHKLPVRREPHVEEPGRTWHLGQLPGRSGWQGQRRRHRGRQLD